MTSPIPSDPARSRAVIIGVDQYLENGLRSYRQLANGAHAIAALFRNPAVWGLAEEHCTVLTGPANTDETAILDAVDRAATEADDTLVLYFAGHGVTWEGQYYLAHSSARPGDCGRWLSWNRLRSRLDDSRTRARSRFVLLDACESADAIDQGTPQGDAALFASCSGTERAWVPPEGRFPVYTGALIDVLAKGDSSLGAFLTPTDIHQAVQFRLTDTNQTPDFLPRRAGGTRPWLRNRAVLDRAAAGPRGRAAHENPQRIPEERSAEPTRKQVQPSVRPAFAAPPQQDELDSRTVNSVMLSIVGSGALLFVILMILVANADSKIDDADVSDDDLSTTSSYVDDYDPPGIDHLSESGISASPAPRTDPLTEAVVGDCLDDEDWTVDGIDLSFEDRCDDDTFEVVEVIEESTDVAACSITGHGYSAVASESAARVLCLKYVYGEGNAAYAEPGECVAGSHDQWPSDWRIVDCEIDTLEVVEVAENESNIEVCDQHPGLAAGYLVSALHDELDVVLCVRLVLPQGDLGHAVPGECLTRTGSGTEVNFKFSDCDSADVVVSGRVSELNAYEACDDEDGWLSWQSSAFPDVIWTVCYRGL